MVTTMLMMGMQLAQAEQVQVPADGHAMNPWVPDGRVAFEINGQTGSIVLFVATVITVAAHPFQRWDKVERTSFGGSTGTVMAPTWNAAKRALLLRGLTGWFNRLYMYSFNGQPPYQYKRFLECMYLF